jgi:putative pyrroloquinoline-quinone binding quinoprotein
MHRLLSLKVWMLLAVLLLVAPPQRRGYTASPDGLLQTLADSWPQVQRDASRSGYVPQSVGSPYTELWRVDTPPVSTRVQPIIAQSLVFLPSNDGTLYALGAANGQVVWSYATAGALVNSVAYADGRVFVGSTDRSIYGLDASDGSLVWEYETGSTVKTAPLVADGKVFMGSSDGFMYALDQAAGTLVWRYAIGAPIYDTAAYDSGMVFFGGMDSAGYALNAATGELEWRLPIPGQGFRDRWTVAGNGHVFFTPMIEMRSHRALLDGTMMFRTDYEPRLYDRSWSVQRQAILQYLESHRQYQPLFVVDQDTGREAFIPPVLYASGGSQSPHSQPVLLPNGNANVIYRRTFGEPANWGETTNDALVTGELDLSTGDIIPVDRCVPGGGGWANCGDYKGAYTSDESAALIRSGDILYLDIARGTYGLDTVHEEMLPTIACYNDGAGPPFYIEDCLVRYDDYRPAPSGWRVHYDSLESEVSSDGNDTKRPTPIVGNTFYVFHYNTLVAVEGTSR